ncbi:MAG: glycoside hydrolase, partial [Acidobacteriia bacterium]|nr:glycoside hydrolase [Terriglobia bacterium]
MKHLLLVAALAVAALSQSVTPAPNPAPAGSLEPNLSTAPDGSLILTWIEPAKDGSASLRYSIRKGATWSEPRTIAANRHF